MTRADEVLFGGLHEHDQAVARRASLGVDGAAREIAFVVESAHEPGHAVDQALQDAQRLFGVRFVEGALDGDHGVSPLVGGAEDLLEGGLVDRGLSGGEGLDPGPVTGAGVVAEAGRLQALEGEPPDGGQHVVAGWLVRNRADE